MCKNPNIAFMLITMWNTWNAWHIHVTHECMEHLNAWITGMYGMYHMEHLECMNSFTFLSAVSMLCAIDMAVLLWSSLLWIFLLMMLLSHSNCSLTPKLKSSALRPILPLTCMSWNLNRCMISDGSCSKCHFLVATRLSLCLVPGFTWFCISLKFSRQQIRISTLHLLHHLR